MATKNGLVKKTPLSQYGRPRKGGIIAIKLREDDELIDVNVTKAGDDIILSTANGMAIRFQESDARPTGRNTSGVKGISLSAGDFLIGMVVVDPAATLLTATMNGYGKRTNFGPKLEDSLEQEDEVSSSNRYRTQNRGGKGVRDIKTTDRNGKVVSILPVSDSDEILLMTSRGKIQRIACSDIKTIGRNTQGVRIMSLDNDDTLAAVVLVPRDEEDIKVEGKLPSANGVAPEAGNKPDSDEPPKIEADSEEEE